MSVLSKERLTERHGELAYCPQNIKCTSKCDDCDHMGKMMDKLAEYEDLEEQNLLLRLPCKVGDTVWIVGNKHICDYKVRRFILSEQGVEAVQIAKNIGGVDYWNNFSLEDIGKTVFLTQSEAEEKLRELEGK